MESTPLASASANTPPSAPAKFNLLPLDLSRFRTAVKLVARETERHIRAAEIAAIAKDGDAARLRLLSPSQKLVRKWHVKKLARGVVAKKLAENAERR